MIILPFGYTFLWYVVFVAKGIELPELIFLAIGMIISIVIECTCEDKVDRRLRDIEKRLDALEKKENDKCSH